MYWGVYSYNEDIMADMLVTFMLNEVQASVVMEYRADTMTIPLFLKKKKNES